MDPHSSALVIFSGGQDSTTCLFWALKKFARVETITFDYGQRHRIELECAQRICERLGVKQKTVSMGFLAQLNRNSLTDASLQIDQHGSFQNLPNTFVPGRNILFLTLAAAYGVPVGLSHLVIGVCETDFSGYPDCRESFISSMQSSLQLGLETPELMIHRPLMNLSKAETFALAAECGGLEEVIELSHTCYEGNRKDRHVWGYGCGVCPACQLRAKGYQEYEKGNIHGTSRRQNA